MRIQNHTRYRVCFQRAFGNLVEKDKHVNKHGQGGLRAYRILKQSGFSPSNIARRKLNQFMLPIRPVLCSVFMLLS